jgi:hypothetical protein
MSEKRFYPPMVVSTVVEVKPIGLTEVNKVTGTFVEENIPKESRLWMKWIAIINGLT